MAALAFMVGAYLVQTRLPKAKCTHIDSNMGVATLHRFKNLKCGLRPSSIQAMRRGSKTPRLCRAFVERSFYKLML